MSALSAILAKEATPVEQQKKTVTTTPLPVVVNSNVQTQVSGSVPDAQKEAHQNQSEPKQLSYLDMFKVLYPYTPPTQEQLKKERKEQKRKQTISAISDGISSLANLYFASKGAPNMYDPKQSMTEKNRALWDKLNKERKDEAARYATGLINAAKLDEERANGERNYQLALKKEEKEDNRWQKTFEANEKAKDEQQQLAREKFEYDKELAKQRMYEATRQFNVSSQQTAQKIKQEKTRLQKEIQKGQVTFALGNGNGTVNVSMDALNAANVSYVFSKLPEEVRATVQGQPIYGTEYDLKGDPQKVITGYAEPSTEAMLIAIGSNVQQYPDVQDALREIAGQKPKDVGKKPNKGNGYNNSDKSNNRGY